MSAEPIAARITGVEHKVRDIKDAVERIANAHSGNQNVTTIKLDGGKSVVTSLLVGLVGGVCLGVSVTVVGWVSWALSDARQTQQADRGDQKAMNNWMAQEVSAIRSYITTGKLAPMAPRPLDGEQPSKDKQ